MKYTENYKLLLPDEDDFFDVLNDNKNMNTLDRVLKNLENHNASTAAHETLFQQKADVTDMNSHVNNTDIHVNPATMGNYDTAISELIRHTEDDVIHTTAAEKTGWTEGSQTAMQAAETASRTLNKTAELESRIARVEDGLFSNITGNPFLVSFDSLDGIRLVKGVWNLDSRRIEC